MKAANSPALGWIRLIDAIPHKTMGYAGKPKLRQKPGKDARKIKA